MKTTDTTYQDKATAFLQSNGLTFKATPAKQQTAPPWSKDGNHGTRYSVTISRTTPKVEHGRPWPKANGHPGRLTFAFWDSIANRASGTPLDAYSVLACIASDIHTPDTFKDFCAEYGYDEDSREAEATFRRASIFSRRLKAFFTAVELEQLQEIN